MSCPLPEMHALVPSLYLFKSWLATSWLFGSLITRLEKAKTPALLCFRISRLPYSKFRPSQTSLRMVLGHWIFRASWKSSTPLATLTCIWEALMRRLLDTNPKPVLTPDVHTVYSTLISAKDEPDHNHCSPRALQVPGCTFSMHDLIQASHRSLEWTLLSPFYG